MNKRKQKLIIMVCICALIFLGGCSEKKITYTYDNKKEITALALTKSVSASAVISYTDKIRLLRWQTAIVYI